MAPFTPTPDSGPSSARRPSPSQTSPSFVPRPFPPPALQGVPHEYIIDTLRKLAPHYWGNAASADCTIVYPLHNYPPGLRPRDKNIPAPSYDLHTEISQAAHDPLGRRFTAPDLNSGPRPVSMKLHADYLSAQSSLIRALFSGISPLDLINPTPQPIRGRPSLPDSSLLPQLQSQNPHHPVIYLPVPDPPSLPYLIFWMYFRTTDHIEHALANRIIKWSRITANVEYLGMPQEIKQFLGRWYGRWLQPAVAARLQPAATPVDIDSDIEEEDEVYNLINGHADDWDVDDQPRGRSRDRLPDMINGLLVI